jgi:hypothetical protein
MSQEQVEDKQTREQVRGREGREESKIKQAGGVAGKEKERKREREREREQARKGE